MSSRNKYFKVNKTNGWLEMFVFTCYAMTSQNLLNHVNDEAGSLNAVQVLGLTQEQF